MKAYTGQPEARFGNPAGVRNAFEVTDDLQALGRGGRWAVAVGFEGQSCAGALRALGGESALDESVGWRSGFLGILVGRAGIHPVRADVQAEIARGWVYQVNLCRVLSAACDADGVLGLYGRLAEMKGGFRRTPATPRAWRAHRVGLSGTLPEPSRHCAPRSSPIKGTSASPAGFSSRTAQRTS